jgi:hypothetical protein
LRKIAAREDVQFLLNRHRGGRESEDDMEGLAEGPRKAAAEPYGEMMWQRLARNPLKSPESDEGIQINPRESKPVSLVLLGLAWIRLG